MKILHIVPDFNTGGAEKFVIDLSNELSKEHLVVICTLFEVDDNMVLLNNLKDNISIISLNKKNGFDITIFYKLYRLVKNEKPDVVNTHLRALFYSTYIIFFTKIPIVHTVHNLANKEIGRKIRGIYKIFFNRFSVTPIGISQKVLSSIQKEYGTNFHTLIENGVANLQSSILIKNVTVEIENYKKNKETQVLLSIGRIVKQKNYEMLIDIMKKYHHEEKNVILLIIGEDPLKDKTLSHNLKKESGSNVYFLGLKSNISDYLLCADAFCLSSLYEGLPITLLEALSLGIIPICTPAGGIVDVLSEETGFISNGFSTPEYLEALETFFSLSKDKRLKMSKKCKLLFQQEYQISKTADKYIKLYENKVKELR